MADDPRVESLIERLNTIEARLDPRPLRRGRLMADLLTLAVIVVLAVFFDWRITHPLVLLLLLLTATGINRLIPFLARLRLRRERDRLTARYERITGREQRQGTPASTSGE